MGSPRSSSTSLAAARQGLIWAGGTAGGGAATDSGGGGGVVLPEWRRCRYRYINATAATSRAGTARHHPFPTRRSRSRVGRSCPWFTRFLGLLAAFSLEPSEQILFRRQGAGRAL